MLVAVAQHAETLRGAGSAYLVNLMDHWGMVRAPSADAVPELKPAGIHTVTDETALIAVLGFGIYLAIASMLAAAWAECRCEENLCLSAGFICGSSALFLVNRLTGLGVLLVGAMAMLLIRRARGANSQP